MVEPTHLEILLIVVLSSVVLWPQMLVADLGKWAVLTLLCFVVQTNHRHAPVYAMFVGTTYYAWLYLLDTAYII